MAWQWPAFLANIQHSRFSSSEPVTAMNTSASSMPASDRVVMEEPLPTMPSTSYVSIRCSTRALFVSTTVTLWPSSRKGGTDLAAAHQNDLHNKSFLLWQPLSRGIQI